MEAGRHAAFIWSAYGAAVAVALGLVLRAVVQGRQVSRALARLEGREVGEKETGGSRG